MMQTNQKKILIVDDTVENLQIAMSYIIGDSVPYAMLAAQNGEIALRIAQQEKPDIIIMDWEMPVMNGIDCIIELKKNPETTNIPVIISTGIRLTPDDLKIAFHAGASDFIRKPLEKTEFLSRINSHLKQAELLHKISQQSIIINESETIRQNEHIELLEAVICENSETISFFGNILEDISTRLVNLNLKNDEIEKIISAIEMLRKKSSVSENTNFNVEKNYIYQLLQKHPNLTPQEIQLCVFIRKDIQTKEIAEITFREPASVKVARSRLRKKLGLEEPDNFHAYLNSI